MNVELLALDEDAMSNLIERLGFGGNNGSSTPALRKHLSDTILAWLREREASEPPSIDRELQRKTLETAITSFDRLADGQISEAEHRATMQTIFSVTSGLLPRDIQKDLDDFPRDVRAKVIEKQVFYKDGTLVILTWAYGSTEMYSGTFYPDGLQKQATYSSESPAAARDRYQDAVKKILAAGFKSI